MRIITRSAGSNIKLVQIQFCIHFGQNSAVLGSAEIPVNFSANSYHVNEGGMFLSGIWQPSFLFHIVCFKFHYIKSKINWSMSPCIIQHYFNENFGYIRQLTFMINFIMRLWIFYYDLVCWMWLESSRLKKVVALHVYVYNQM